MNELPSSAVGVLEMFSTSQTGIDIFSDQLIQSVKAGETSPLKMLLWIKTIEKIIKRVNEETKINQITAAEFYSERKFDFGGATIEKAEVGTTYDYNICQDIEWERLDADLKSIAEKKKDRETFLKALREPLVIVDQDSGEVSKVMPPLKKSESGLKVTIK